MTREDGQAGGVEAIAFGLLVLVVGALIIVNGWSVIDATTAARTAAREGARTFATAGNGTTAADNAITATRRTLHDMGWTDPNITVNVTGAFLRCSIVTDTVRIPVRFFRTGVVWASASDSQRVDPYRSGVPGDTQCPTP
jgi:hypothetical protein